MESQANRYCSIFVSTDFATDKLKLELSELLTALETGYYCVDVIRNSDFDKTLQYQFPDGFLYFKIKLEIEFKESAVDDFHVNFISKILNWLWGNYIPAVAAC